MDISLWLLLWSAFALFCGGVIKGTLGIGTPLLTVPMLTIVLPIQIAITLMCMPILVANVIQAVQAPRSLDIVRTHWLTGLSIVIGSLVGVLLLSTLDERPLLIMVACAVMVFTFVQATGSQLYFPANYVRTAGIFAGLGGGIIGGMSSMFGPVLVMYLMSIRNLEKDRFVSVVSFLYLCAVVPWPFQLAYLGLLDLPLLVLSVLAVLPVAAGLYVGGRIRQSVTERLFRKGILMVLMISATTLLWRALVR